MTIVSEAVIDLAKQRLLTRAGAVCEVALGPTVEISFSLTDLRQGVASKRISTWLSGETWPYPTAQPAIYVIAAGNAETATTLMQEFLVKTLHFAAPRVNADAEGSSTLYVGSSQNVKKRLGEHLWRAACQDLRRAPWPLVQRDGRHGDRQRRGDPELH